VWRIGQRYFYGMGHPLDRMLLAGRMAAAVWGVAASLAVYLWSRRLFGTTGGCVSLVVAATDPTMLAHGPLATSDMAAACLLLAATTAVWRLLLVPTPLTSGQAAAAVGLLAIAKPSAVLIGPITVVLVVARVWVGGPWPTRRTLLAACGGMLVGALAIIWAAYGFRYSACNAATLPPGEFFRLRSLEGVAESLGGLRGALLEWGGRLHVLPEAFLYGLGYVLRMTGRNGFLCGSYSKEGWWWFFPFTFAVKTPLTTLLGLAAAGVMLARGRGRGIAVRRWLPLAALAGVYGLAAITASLNIGHRHLLPLHLPAFILLGAIAPRQSPAEATGRPDPRLAWGLTGLVLAGSVWTCGTTFPHYIGHFNGLVTRSQAYRCLVDSNVDWGQELPRLAAWLANRPEIGGRQEPAFVAYFGMGDLGHYRVAAADMKLGRQSLGPGWYCVSASTLQGVWDAQPWTAALEAEYRDTVAAYLALPDKRAARGDPAHADLFASLARLQYLRLLGHLRDRRPDADIAGSILMFHVSGDELARYLGGPSPRQVDMSRYPEWRFP
jgi:hypothetical protein